MKNLLFLFVLLNFSFAHAQTIPAIRTVNWQVAGIKDTTTQGFTIVDGSTYGFVNDGVTPNDYPLGSLMLAYQGPTIVNFPAGTYLFNAPIYLRSNFIIRGAGADQTTFIIDHPNNGHSFYANGYATNDTSSLAQAALKGSNQLVVVNASAFAVGNWIQLLQNDVDLTTTAWAAGSVGQIAQIIAISGNTLSLASEMRMDYLLQRSPAIRRILPVENTGIECLKIQRVDNAAPEQASNISFEYVVNSWVNGVAFQNTTFAHIEANHSSNIDIANCHFKDAFEYGDGGRGYGVILQFSTNECRVYNNIFDHLRHSMILQAGANGNVFCYNYSINPFWTGSSLLPSNAAGDMVLHGNYVFANLFEQNDGQNIVIDNSHGGNGPLNTFFRNRASLWGIFFSDTTSPGQNFVGNEIPNNSFPYNVVNFNLLGSNHFLFGNNNKNTITPTGTGNLSDISYCFAQRPSFIPLTYWAEIGPENTMNSGKIPAGIHYQLNELTAGSCGATSAIGISENAVELIAMYPNPVQSGGQIHFNKTVKSVEFYLVTGKICFNYTASTESFTAPTPTIAGFYTMVITDMENRVSQHPIVIFD